MRIWSLSWKNVWRNPMRSAVVMVAVMLGITGGIFLIAFWMGMVEQRVNDIIKNETTHIQVHQPEYLENNEIKYYIEDTDSIVQNLSGWDAIAGVSPRTIVQAMISSAKSGSGVKVTGVMEDKEKKVTQVHQAIPDSVTVRQKLGDTTDTYIQKYLSDSVGNYFNEDRNNEIVIGEKLAHKLKVRVRSKVVLTFQDINGTLTGAAFRIAGIYKTNNTTFDETNAFVKKSDLDKVTSMEENASHEIAILLNDFRQSDQISKEIQAKYPDLEVRAWKEIKPELSLTSDMMKAFNYIFVLIILLALGFGIVNTMLMVVLERVKELGMLMAIGMNRAKVFTMIMFETVFLTIIGAIIGMGLSYLIITLTNESGINLHAFKEGFEAMGYSTTVYPVLGAEYFINITLMVVLTGIVASIYPAIKALSFNPADAIRTE